MKLVLVSSIFKEGFTDASWSSPASNLSAEAYCSVCLVDNNTGGEKVKGECHYPYRSRPGAPINKHALAAIYQNMQGARTEKKFSVSSAARAKFNGMYKRAFGHAPGKEDGEKKD